jgi:hypothetical protein
MARVHMPVRGRVRIDPHAAHWIDHTRGSGTLMRMMVVMWVVVHAGAALF